MKPYYQDESVTLYHGDCRDVLPSLQWDVVLADPPYGIDWNPDNKRFTSTSSEWWSTNDRSAVSQMNPIVGDSSQFDPSPFISYPAILWGANHYASRLPDSGGWLVWDKRAGLEDVGDKWPMSEGELAWTNTQGRVSFFRLRWMGLIRPENERHRYHPNQKPEALMAWCLGRLPAGIVLDPYAGSGTTLVAAKRLGRKAIGIEIEEAHCASAVNRLRQGALTEMFQ